MSTERHVEPELLQKMDSVYEELRTEEAALLRMPSENEKLRARVERLQRGRDRLREALRRGQSGHEPHLPEELELPFSVQPSVSEARRIRDVLSLLVLGALALALQWEHLGSGTVTLFLFLAGISAVRLIKTWRKHRSWFFLEHGIEVWDTWKGKKPAAFLRYNQVVDAEARVTPAQLRRGVGTVVVKYQPAPGMASQSMTLENAPEPERLVKWLRAQRQDAPPGA